MNDASDPFPPGFFDRRDESDDARFYAPERFVAHIDDGAIAAVGSLYEELGLTGPGATGDPLYAVWARRR